VNVVPYQAAWHGFVLSREDVVTDDIDYWAKIKGKQFHRYEIAGKDFPNNPVDWAKHILGNPEEHEWLEYMDVAKQRYRYALIKNERLQSVIFISPSHENPSRAWLGEQFQSKKMDDMTRRSLLAAKASGAKDVGKTICSCFGVGINTIIEAIHEDKLVTAEDIGAVLKAGTNCGSCVPELTEILAVELAPK